MAKIGLKKVALFYHRAPKQNKNEKLLEFRSVLIFVLFFFCFCLFVIDTHQKKTDLSIYIEYLYTNGVPETTGSYL